MKTFFAFLAAVLCLSVLASAPASAKQRNHVITMNGGGWGARAVATEYSHRVKNLTIRFGKCRYRAPEEACYHIETVNEPTSFWYGMTYRYAGLIQLNNYWREGHVVNDLYYNPANLRHVACHEVGHALGLEHTGEGYDDDGCMAKWSQDLHPSSSEIAAVTNYWAAR